MTVATPSAKGTFTVRNSKGLHTRPASEVAKLASRFKSKITLHHYDMSVNAKSLLGILMMAAARGSRIKVEAEGPDADEAIAALIALADDMFNIKY